MNTFGKTLTSTFSKCIKIKSYFLINKKGADLGLFLFLFAISTPSLSLRSACYSQCLSLRAEQSVARQSHFFNRRALASCALKKSTAALLCSAARVCSVSVWPSKSVWFCSCCGGEEGVEEGAGCVLVGAELPVKESNDCKNWNIPKGSKAKISSFWKN